MPETGSVLQTRYQLKEQLSDNPTRETWLAHDLTSEQPVVIKLLVFGGQNQWENLKLFEREAKVLQNLDHPRIPRYQDYFAIDDRGLWSALVQDYIPGSSLMALLDSGKKFAVDEVRQIARALLDILSYLHELSPPVLHRDIKPSNIILGEDGEVYLVDFGSVQDQGAVAGRSFTVVGTYGYTPLEQFGGQTVAASDLYALGATLIHLLTGTAPAELLQKDLRLDFRDRISSTVSPYFIRWLQKLAEPQIDKRFRTAADAIASLESSSSLSAETASLYQPEATQIQLNQSLERLEINIPEPGRRILDGARSILQRCKKSLEGAISAVRRSISGSDLSSKVLVYILIGIGSVSFLSVALQLVIGLLPVGILTVICASLTDYFEQTHISLDAESDRLEIEHKRLGFTYRREIGLASEIQDVSIYYDNKKFVMGITITAYSKGALQQYSFGQFGRKMTEEECIWLAQEIRDWLAYRQDLAGSKN